MNVLCMLLCVQVCKTVLSLPVCVREQFPNCCEYLVRAGWSHDGKWVWFQLVDRVQRHLKMVLVDWKAFSVKEEQVSCHNRNRYSYRIIFF